MRQLYDVVRQVAAAPPRETDQKSLLLKGLEINPILVDNLPASDPEEDDQLITQAEDDTTVEDQKEINAFVQALRVLNSSAIIQHRDLDVKQPFQFLIHAKWSNSLPEEAKAVLRNAGVTTDDSLNSVQFYYGLFLDAIATKKQVTKPTLFKSGIFTIGPFNLEITRPLTFPAANIIPIRPSPKVTPKEKKVTSSQLVSQIFLLFVIMSGLTLAEISARFKTS
jgi:hypothetical protein